MSTLRINGGKRLAGEIEVHGAKNSVLPILAASLLANGETVIHNCPGLSDVDAAVKILRHLGCGVKREDTTITIDSSTMDRCDIPDALMREMRSSVIFLGAIVARCGEAVLSMPGGCELGPRPIDMHLAALKSMGAEITETGGNIICRSKKLHGARIDFLTPSVGATENSMVAASCIEGTTVINNAAREPEICDLQDYLNKLGANVSGAGTPVIVVEGRSFKGSAEHTVIPDRIVAATYLTAVACAGGDVVVKDLIPAHVSTITQALEEMGCHIETHGGSIRIVKNENRLVAPRPVITRPYPGFPTDAQPMLMSATLTAAGTTVFVENIFENRFRHVSELRRMGADVKTEGRVAIVSGVEKLHAAPVAATDLRGGAALVVAALGAEGTSVISELKHIDRGYYGLENALRGIGVDIERV